MEIQFATSSQVALQEKSLRGVEEFIRRQVSKFFILLYLSGEGGVPLLKRSITTSFLAH